MVRQGDLLDPSSLVASPRGGQNRRSSRGGAARADLPSSVVRRVNVEGSANLARAAVRCQVAQFVHGSSAGVYGDGTTLDCAMSRAPWLPATLYERPNSKRSAPWSSELAHTPVAWSILRPSGLHGPGRLASAQFLSPHLSPAAVDSRSCNGGAASDVRRRLRRGHSLHAWANRPAGGDHQYRRTESLTYRSSSSSREPSGGSASTNFSFLCDCPAALRRSAGLGKAARDGGQPQPRHHQGAPAHRLRAHPLEAGIDETIDGRRREQLL